MSKSRNIIILVVVLALLAGSYLFLANRPEPEDTEPVNKKISLLRFDKNDISKMELNNEHGQLVIHRVEKEVEEEKDGKKEKVTKAMWEVEYPHEIAIKQTSVDDVAYSFANLEAERIIEEETPEDLTPYGLADPEAVAHVSLQDGTKHTVYVGSKTPAGNTYYLMLDDDPKIYEVWLSHGDHFKYAIDDLRDKSLPSVDAMDFAYLKIDKKDGRPIEITLNDKQSDEQASFGLGLWKMIKPYKEPMGVDGDAIQKFLESVPTFTIQEFVEDGVEDFAKYGLDEESATEFIFKDSENTLHLILGKEYGEGKVYFRTPDSQSVYGMDKSKLDFMDIKPFKLVEKFAYIVSIDDVDKVVIEGKGKSFTLSMERETIKAENEDEEDEVVTTYFADGQEVEEKAFKKAYQSIIGILADNETDKEPEGDPEIRTIFYLNKGKNREVHINYVPYDNDFYTVFRSGKAEFVVNKARVHKMLDDMEALIQGTILDK